MNFIFIIIFVALVMGITLLIYRVTKFEYTIEEKHLIMKWYFLGLLPVKIKIKIDSIIEVQEINSNRFFSTLLKSKPWPIFWGKFSRKLVLIKRKGFFGTVLISPPDPDTFVKILEDKNRDSDR